MHVLFRNKLSVSRILATAAVPLVGAPAARKLTCLNHAVEPAIAAKTCRTLPDVAIVKRQRIRENQRSNSTTRVTSIKSTPWRAAKYSTGSKFVMMEQQVSNRSFTSQLLLAKAPYTDKTKGAETSNKRSQM